MTCTPPIISPEIGELEARRRELCLQVQEVCNNYGLYGSVMLYHPSPVPDSHRNKLYLVATRNPEFIYGNIPFDPEYFLRRNARSDRLIYTDVFVYDLAQENNRLDAMEKLVEYCKNTEFLVTLYGRYSLPAPDKLRRFEIRQLMDARDMQRNEPMGPLWRQATDSLNEFFSKEMKSGWTKKWLDFFRSDKYPDDAGPMEKLRAFHNRNQSQVSLEQLMACHSSIRTLEMQEHEYRRFAQYMQTIFPEVPYAVSKKIVIDNGTHARPDEMEQTYGKRVTGEEFDQTLERTFLEDDGASIQMLRPSYFEIRKISYPSVDEPYVATAFHDATLCYARWNDLSRIRGRGGELQLYSIPKEDFMSFVSMARANGLLFYIDISGEYEIPSLLFLNVLCSSRDESLIQAILNRIVEEKVDCSHLIPEEERTMLQDIITQATEANFELNGKEAHQHEGKKDYSLNL